MRLMFRSMLSVVAAALALGTVAATAASAEAHEWRINGSEVKSPTTVTGSGQLELEDRNARPGNKVTCSVSDKGSVTTKGEGSVTEVKLTSCSSPEFCEAGTVTASAVGLPWKTTLITRNEEVWNEVRESGAGQVGVSWKCVTVLKTQYSDKCTVSYQLGSLLQESTGVDEVIKDEIFGNGSPLLNCELGGTGQGFLRTGNHIKTTLGTLTFR